jgi:hypothetical protein
LAVGVFDGAAHSDRAGFHNFPNGGLGALEVRCQQCVTSQRKMAPLNGAIHLAASLRSPVVVVVMMVVMVMMRLCTWNRADGERNSGDGGQHESKLPHQNISLG